MIRLLITHDEAGNPLPRLAPAKLQHMTESLDELDLAGVFTATQAAIAAGDSDALIAILEPGRADLVAQIEADLNQYR
jgi:hypothetical protein